jgi:large subunit ribosomal protein L9
MELLLCKTVEHLGIVGDVVNVSPGYARNYLLPQRLATEPTEANRRAVAEARRQAEIELAKHRAVLEELAKRLEGVEVTIHARANEAGVLYGSVGRREIAAALNADGYGVLAEKVQLRDPIRTLDKTEVEIRLADDLRPTVKVWVVREKIEGESEEEGATPEPRAEADTDDDDTGE